MFKILTIVVGFYILYRLFAPANRLGGNQPDSTLDDPGEDDYVDYEEVE